MADPITQTYRDVEVTLREDENTWSFTVNGRQRSAPTLPKAREYIDNALDEVKAGKVKAWEPFMAWTDHGFGGLRKVKVTSQAERSYSNPEFWTVDQDAKDHRGRTKPERKKISINWLYEDTDANAERVRQIEDYNKRVAALNDEQEKVKGALTKMPIPSSD